MAGVVVLGAVVGLAGCGASAGGTGSAGSSAPAWSAATGTATPDPNAPEVVAAGDIPDNQGFVPVIILGAASTVSVPQGWVQTSDGRATVFTDKFNSVRIAGGRLAVAPDVASVRSRDVPQLQGSVRGFALGGVQSVQRASGPAILVTYTGMSAPSAVTGKSVTEAVERYAFWRGGREVVLTLSGPMGSDNVDPWRKITDSFRWQ